MSFYQTDQIDGFNEAMREAIARGVSVEVIVRQEHFADEIKKGQYPDPSTRQLLQSGARLFGVEKLHAKAIVVDGERMVYMSANFNNFSFQGTEDAHHLETGICCSKDSVKLKAAELCAFLDGLPAVATHEFVVNSHL
jgi:phosphatidylserine/phosphatidylglycerophosphate/cardiolipin synthase-like enzyme